MDFPDFSSLNKVDGSKTKLTDAIEEVLNGTVPNKVDIVYTHVHYDHMRVETRVYEYIHSKHSAAKKLIWMTTRNPGEDQDI